MAGRCIEFSDNTTYESNTLKYNKIISQTRSVLPELATFKVSFPPVSITSCDVQCFSPQCNKLEKGRVISIFLSFFCPYREILIKNEAQTWRFNQQFDSYVQKDNIDKPSDEESVLVTLLSDSSTTLICDSRAICIDVEVK